MPWSVDLKKAIFKNKKRSTRAIVLPCPLGFASATVVSLTFEKWSQKNGHRLSPGPSTSEITNLSLSFLDKRAKPRFHEISKKTRNLALSKKKTRSRFKCLALGKKTKKLVLKPSAVSHAGK